MNKKPKQLTTSSDEFWEVVNNMPRKQVLYLLSCALWQMLEEQYKGNRKIEKNSM
jgi:hypothetical protein